METRRTSRDHDQQATKSAAEDIYSGRRETRRAKNSGRRRDLLGLWSPPEDSFVGGREEKTLLLLNGMREKEITSFAIA